VFSSEDVTVHFANALVEYSGYLKAAVKYEYEKYYQVNAGVKLMSSSNIPYYTNSTIPGRFDAAFVDGHLITAFADMLFYTGPNGYFYGSADFTLSGTTSKLRIPYVPWVNGSLAYGNRINGMNLDAEVKLNYTSDVFTDLSNYTKLNNNINLGVKFSYQYRPKFLITLELSNLLFQKQYIWQRYQEMPFNITAGLNIIL